MPELDFHDGVARQQPAEHGLAVREQGCAPSGGELVVEDNYGSHEIKLPAGDLVLYPASSLHMVTPVTRGVRVASFFWLQSMIRDAHARSLIFDLDIVIQALVERLGRDDPETVKLTGIYHNLIRSWAEV